MIVGVRHERELRRSFMGYLRFPIAWIARGGVSCGLILVLLAVVACSRHKLEFDREYVVGGVDEKIGVMLRVEKEPLGSPPQLSPMIVVQLRNLRDQPAALHMRAAETIEVDSSNQVRRRLTIAVHSRTAPPPESAASGTAAGCGKGVLCQPIKDGPIDLAPNANEEYELGRTGIRPNIEGQELKVIWGR